LERNLVVGLRNGLELRHLFRHRPDRHRFVGSSWLGPREGRGEEDEDADGYRGEEAHGTSQHDRCGLVQCVEGHVCGGPDLPRARGGAVAARPIERGRA